MTVATAMNFKLDSPYAGYQPIGVTSTTQNHPIGSICRGRDDLYGEAEFVYWLGVASTVVGDVCVLGLDSTPISAGSSTVAAGTLVPASTRVVASSRGRLGLAMSANVASQYGWYMTRGMGLMNCTANVTVLCALTPPVTSPAAGSLDIASTGSNNATDKVSGIVPVVATGTGSPGAGTGKALVVLTSPCMDGSKWYTS